MARAGPPIPLVMRPRLNGSLPRPAGLEAACAETGRSRGEIVRDALRRQLQLMRFERLRHQALPHGAVAGWLTDDDGCLRLSSEARARFFRVQRAGERLPGPQPLR